MFGLVITTLTGPFPVTIDGLTAISAQVETVAAAPVPRRLPGVGAFVQVTPVSVQTAPDDLTWPAAGLASVTNRRIFAPVTFPARPVTLNLR